MSRFSPSHTLKCSIVIHLRIHFRRLFLRSSSVNICLSLRNLGINLRIVKKKLTALNIKNGQKRVFLLFLIEILLL